MSRIGTPPTALGIDLAPSVADAINTALQAASGAPLPAPSGAESLRTLVSGGVQALAGRYYGPGGFDLGQLGQDAGRLLHSFPPTARALATWASLLGPASTDDTQAIMMAGDDD